MDTHTQQDASVYLKEAMDFVNQVYSRFRHRRHKFISFLDSLLSLQSGHNMVHNVNALASLFVEHPDLLHTFRGFFSHSQLLLLSPSPGASADHQRDFSRSANEARDFLKKVSRRLDKARFSAFVKVIKRCQVRELDRNESRKEVASYIGEFSDLMDAYERFWDQADKVKDSLSCLHDDPGDCDCGPSYRRRPGKRRQVDAQAQVLNDDWVCGPVSNDNGNYGGNQKIISRQEELQNKLEDQRYEMDMMLQFLTTTAKSAENLLEMIKSDINLKTPIQVEDYFSTSNLRCIKKLYGVQSYEVIDMLGENPTRVLPTLLKRLRQKEECLRSHLELRKAADAYTERQKQIQN